MDDMPLLRVIIGKTVIYGSIPSAFVSIAPKEDARMIDISGYHFRKQACGNAIAITVLPASQFVHIKQAQRVAKLQEMFVGRIVRTYGIHVHLFDKAGILQVELPTYATSGFRVETMPIGTFHQQFDSIKINTISWSELHGSETDTVCHLVKEVSVRIQQTQGELVKMGMFRIPFPNIIPLRRKRLLRSSGKLEHPLSHQRSRSDRCQFHLQPGAFFQVSHINIGA